MVTAGDLWCLTSFRTAFGLVWHPLLRALAHADGAPHPCLIVAGQQAGKLEITRAIEGPDQVTRLARLHMRHPGLVMLHIRVLEHQCGVRVELITGTNHHFVHERTAVTNDETNRLAEPDIEVGGLKAHVIAHADFKGSPSRRQYACHAPWLLVGSGRGTGGLTPTVMAWAVGSD